MASETIQHEKFTWSWPQVKTLLVCTYHDWSEVEAPRMGASLAYYTVLSLAPLLIIVIAIASFAFGEQAARGALVAQIQTLVGKEGAQAVQGIIQHAAEKKSTGVLASVIGFLTLLFGASSVALELRSAMNKIWAAKEAEGVAGFLKQRSYALGIVLGAGFLLLVSLVVSAVLASVGKFFGEILPFPAWVAQIINILISLVVITALFALIFKLLPAVPLRWHDVWVGAIFTGLLFTIGKTLIGIYLGSASIGSSYGAAGSLILILVWIYYSSQIFFMGAEFTRVYAQRHGSQPQKPPVADAAKQPTAESGTTASGIPIPAPVDKPLAESVAVLAGSLAGLAHAVVNVFSSDKNESKRPG